MKKSLSLSIKYAFFFSLAVVLISALSAFFIAFSIQRGQSKELSSSCQKLFLQIKAGDFSGLSVPYSISFLVYDEVTKESLATNDPFLPALAVTDKAKRYFEKDFFSDGDLDILYLCQNYSISDSSGSRRSVNVLTAMDMESDSASKIVEILPKSILVILVPILLLSFAVLFYFFIRLKIDYDSQKEFIANVSHELKTPLTVIEGHAGLLSRHGKKLIESDEEKFEKSISMIQKESENMAGIISTFLEITRLENGLVKPNYAELNIGDFFGELKDEFETENVKIAISENRVPSDLKITTDQKLFHQLFVILTSNSIKHAHAENLKITLSAKKSGKHTILTMHDNGKGFSKEALSHAFERFYSGDKSHKTGSGIGLSVARLIADILKLKITIENADGAVVKIFS